MFDLLPQHNRMVTLSLAMVLMMVVLSALHNAQVEAEPIPEPKRATALYAPKVSDQEARSFVDDVIVASDSRDHAALRKAFSEDAFIEIQLGDDHFSYTRDEYLATLSHAKGQQYQHEQHSEIQDVKIKGRRAMVVLKVNETIGMEGFGKITSTSSQAVILEKQPNGQVKIISWSVKADYNQTFL